MDRQIGLLGQTEIRSHVEMLHDLARRVGRPGVLVVASYGEDPDGINPKNGNPGKPITAKARHFPIGDVDGMVACVHRFSKDKFRNVYISLALMRPDLPQGAKGFETDVVALLGVVGDFDDADAANWENRLPVPANYVLETSPGRFQAFLLFDQAVDGIKGKALAEGLQSYARCDYGTKDVSHVWRVPGCLNHPNAKKVFSYGRSREPGLVRVLTPWSGDLTSVELLTEALSGVRDDLLSSRKPVQKEVTAQSPDKPADKPSGNAPAPMPSIDVGLVVRRMPDKLKARIDGSEFYGRSLQGRFFRYPELGRAWFQR